MQKVEGSSPFIRFFFFFFVFARGRESRLVARGAVAEGGAEPGSRDGGRC